jgi:hypothetical protein
VDKCVAKPREARHIQWRRSIAGEFRAAVLVKHKPAVPQKCNQDQPDQCIDFLHPEGCGTDVIVCKGENAPLFVAEYEISQPHRPLIERIDGNNAKCNLPGHDRGPSGRFRHENEQEYAKRDIHCRPPHHQIVQEEGARYHFLIKVRELGLDFVAEGNELLFRRRVLRRFSRSDL